MLMNQAEKDQLVSMFVNHLNEILRLHSSNIQGAEALCSRPGIVTNGYCIFRVLAPGRSRH